LFRRTNSSALLKTNDCRTKLLGFAAVGARCWTRRCGWSGRLTIEHDIEVRTNGSVPNGDNLLLRIDESFGSVFGILDEPVLSLQPNEACNRSKCEYRDHDPCTCQKSN